MLETLGGPLLIDLKLIKAKLELLGRKDLESSKPIEDNNAVLGACKEYSAFLALSGANGTKFGGLKDKLENKSLFGNDNYPKDQAKLLHIMNKYKPKVARIQRINHKNAEGVAFIQDDKTTK